MRLFFDGMPSSFCENVISLLVLSDVDRLYLNARYAEGLSDKEVARKLGLSPDRVNKIINNALVNAYDSLKSLQYNSFKATK